MINPSAIAPSRGPELPQASATGPVPGAPPVATPQAAIGGATPAWPNPSLQIDPVLGIVVMEFRDRAGSVAATLPTERQLEAYRDAASRPRPDATLTATR